MSEPAPSLWDEMASPVQVQEVVRWAQRRNGSMALLAIGWLHLLAFSLCYYLTIIQNYHEAPAYLAIWTSEMAGTGLLLYFLAGPCREKGPAPPLVRFLVRVWVAYFLLAFNLCSMNALRGHRMFELFPAMASLASFAFLVMTFVISRRFFAAVLVMFVAGLLMALSLDHAYLVFALAWWVVLQGVALQLWRSGRTGRPGPVSPFEKTVPVRADPSRGTRSADSAGRPCPVR